MKKLFIGFIIVAMTLAASMSNIEAKRMGSGSSFGKKLHNINGQTVQTQKSVTNTAKLGAAPSASSIATSAKPSMWKGILSGALLGLGLGALLSSIGLGSAAANMISNMIMIAAVTFSAMFIYKLIRRKISNSVTSDNSMQSVFSTSTGSRLTPEISSRIEKFPHLMQHTAFEAVPPAKTMEIGVDDSDASDWAVPTDFDTVGFLRHSKIYFLRLQAAWDRGDSNDIREFTTPEMFSELCMQLEERGTSDNHTDVVTLSAEFIGIKTIDPDYLVSVKFTGMIKENGAAVAAPFSEIWNLSKPITGHSGWILAGIEQVEQNT